MRLVRVAAPGADADLTDQLGAAFRAFNAGLDIRLRFLSIGIEDRLVEVGDAAEATRTVDGLLAGGDVAAVLLDGTGPAALGAATVTVRRGVALVRLGAGRRDDDPESCRAIERLAALLVADPDGLGTLRSEGMSEQDVARRVVSTAAVAAPGNGAGKTWGERVIAAVRRVGRRSPRAGEES